MVECKNENEKYEEKKIPQDGLWQMYSAEKFRGWIQKQSKLWLSC